LWRYATLAADCLNITTVQMLDGHARVFETLQRVNAWGQRSRPCAGHREPERIAWMNRRRFRRAADHPVAAYPGGRAASGTSRGMVSLNVEPSTWMK